MGREIAFSGCLGEELIGLEVFLAWQPSQRIEAATAGPLAFRRPLVFFVLVLGGIVVAVVVAAAAEVLGRDGSAAQLMARGKSL